MPVNTITCECIQVYAAFTHFKLLQIMAEIEECGNKSMKVHLSFSFL